MHEATSNIYHMINLLADMPGFDSFVKERDITKHTSDFIDAFLAWRSEHLMTNKNDETTIRIIQEKIQAYKHENNKVSPLSGFYKQYKVHDCLVSDFDEDVLKCRIGKVYFTNADVQHYKTIKEKIANIAVDISPIYDKYKNSNNPYINAQLAEILNRGKQYNIGLLHLYQALIYALSYPNPYWDTPIAVYGCMRALWELQYLLGKKGLTDLTTNTNRFCGKILEMLYLLLSRSIHIEENSLLSAICLSLRADLMYDYNIEYMYIFNTYVGLGVNIEIQYMADKAFSHEIAASLGLASVFEQQFKDSLKMYQHGNLVPYNSIGIRDVEDETMGQLNSKAWKRSIILDTNLYGQYQKGEYFFDKSQITEIISYLHNKYITSK